MHERADRLRTTGAGIYIYENGLRVLEAVGAYEAAVKGAPFAHTREVRDGRDRLISVHTLGGQPRVQHRAPERHQRARGGGDARRRRDRDRTRRPPARRADGELMLADGRRIKADLIVGADGSNSRLRDSLGLLSKRKYLVDGCTRLLMDKTEAERGDTDGAKTIEYWSGTRRVLYTPCSETDIYIALTMLDSDEAAKAVPVRKDDWKRWFPHLEALIDRIGEQGRYDRFDLIKLKRWSAGRVAIDRRCRACAAAEYRPGRRLRHDERAVARGLSRARETMSPTALETWERKERPITEHTQRISYFLGLPTTWPPALRALALGMAGRSKWLVRAAHAHGAASADGDVDEPA